MNTLGKDKETQMVHAAEQMVDYVNSGMEPNAALHKVATDHAMTPAFISRMAEVFNTSRVLAHMRQAPAEKRADTVPLADASVVIKQMYKPTETAETCKSAWFSPPPNFLAVKLITVMKKAAAKIDEQTSPAELVHAAIVRINAATQHTKAAKADAQYCREQVLQKTAHVAQYFREMSHLPFEVVETNALSKYGSVVKPLMDTIYNACEGRLFKERRGVKSAGETVFNLALTPYKQLDEVVAWSRKWAKAAAEYQTAYDDEMNVKRLLVPRLRKLAALEGRRIPTSFTFQKTALIADLIGSASGSVLGRLAESGKNTSTPEEDILKSIDPDQETVIRAARSKAMVNDWIANDPVISGYDPHTVMEAFNEISSVTPRVADQPGMLRGMLSRRLEFGRTEPFEAGTALAAETALRGFDHISGDRK